jgi:phosphoribosyl 1,2-cyclic phosphodiesterase
MRKNLTKRLKFWGTRGSCPVSGPEYQHFGGNTACLEVCYDDTHFIIDAGSGIRPLGNQLSYSQDTPIHIFISHTHWDHINGFPFFKPLSNGNQPIIISSPLGSRRSTEELFHQLLSPEFSPIQFDKIKNRVIFQTIKEKTPIQMGPIVLDFHQTYHTDITLCFKIKTPHEVIGYVTDNEMFRGYCGAIDKIPQELLESHFSLIHFLSECDVLIHEAQYLPQQYEKKINWGHSSLLNTIALIKESQIQQWFVTHHEPEHTDDDLKNLEKNTKKLKITIMR